MAWHATWNPPERRPMFMGRGTTPAGVTLVLAVTIAAFLFDMLMRGGLTAHGALTVNSLRHGYLWRLVTFQFLHSGIEHIFWNMFILWMFGVVLERQLGTKQFLILYLLSGAAGGLLEVAFNLAMNWHYGLAYVATPKGLVELNFLQQPTVGASAGVAGVLVAFAVINPRAEVLLFFLIPIEARWLAIGYVVIETIPMVQGLVGHRLDSVAHAAHLGGMAMGYVWVKYGASVARWMIWREKHAEQGYYARSPEREAEEEAEVNRILEKIHREGLDSLTLREKLFLQEMSRRRNRPR